MISKFFNHLVNSFGFNCTGDFSNSIIHTKLLAVTIPVAGFSSLLEITLGLRHLTILAFVVLITLELLTGLIASKIRGEKIVSHKFSRFGFKVFVWLILLYVINTMKVEYSQQTNNNFTSLASGFFTWLHGTLFIYIVIEYLISILENLGVITKKKNDNIIKTIIKKLNNFLGNEKNKDHNENN